MEGIHLRRPLGAVSSAPGSGAGGTGHGIQGRCRPGSVDFVKILLLSPFHPELMKGGAQQVCYELFEGLKDVPDIEPILLAAVDESFGFLFKSGAHITGFDGRENEFIYLSRD